MLLFTLHLEDTCTKYSVNKGNKQREEITCWVGEKSLLFTLLDTELVSSICKKSKTSISGTYLLSEHLGGWNRRVAMCLRPDWTTQGDPVSNNNNQKQHQQNNPQKTIPLKSEHFLKEVQIANKCMKKYAICLTIRKMQIKTTLRFHLNLPERLLSRIQKITNAGEAGGMIRENFSILFIV